MLGSSVATLPAGLWIPIPKMIRTKAAGTNVLPKMIRTKAAGTNVLTTIMLGANVVSWTCETKSLDTAECCRVLSWKCYSAMDFIRLLLSTLCETAEC